MDPWLELDHQARLRHGVADVVLAAGLGIPEDRFYRRTAREGWGAPAPRVRIHPRSGPSLQRTLLVACSSTHHLAAATRETAAWLHGLLPRPPARAAVVVAYGSEGVAVRGTTSRRARWLVPTDVVEIDHVPTLTPEAAMLSWGTISLAIRRGWIIDLLHRGATDLDRVEQRFGDVGPVPGKGVTLRLCREFAASRTESVFQHLVAEELARRGYGPDRSTRRIDSADGRGLTIDVPLPRWRVAVEPDGDTFHRTREQRRRDRRRDAAFAGTDWVRVPVDWRDWHHERGHVLDAIDAAIEAQRARGIGRRLPPPSHR